MQRHRFLPFFLTLLAGVAWASATQPNLLIKDASLIEIGGIRQLRLEGSFHYDDLVQVAYPFQLIVYTQEGHFVRYDLSGAVYTGKEPSLGDGIDLAEAEWLLRTHGRKASAEVVSLTPGVIELRLPDELPRAALWVQIFVEDKGRIVFSNPEAVDEEVLR